MSAGKEIVFSVDETNKIREDLGLKPLDTEDDGKDENGVAAPGTSKIENDVLVAPVVPGEKKRTEELRTKISTAKEKRKLEKKLKKVALLSDATGNDDSAAAWIKKSRTKSKAKSLAAAQAKQYEDLDADQEEDTPAYTAKDLAGIMVAHDKADLEEGHEVILTLADTGVLDGEDDVLENVNMAENTRVKANFEDKKGLKTYQAYAEDKFDAYGDKVDKGVLSKYNNIDIMTGVEKKKEVDGFTLNSGGGADLQREREAAAIRENLKKQTQTLETELSIGTDFYTPEEMSKFKKKTRRKVRKNKKKMLTADDLLPIEDEETPTDHGSRSKRKRSDRDEATGGVTVTGAADAVAVLSAKVAEKPSEDAEKVVKKVKVDMPMDMDEDDDQDVLLDDEPAQDEAELAAEAAMRATIERARRVAQKKRREISSDQSIANAVRQMNSNEVTEGGGEGETVSSKPRGGDIVLTTMQEFVATIGRDKVEKKEEKVEEKKKEKEPSAQTDTGDAMEVDGDNQEAEDEVQEPAAGWKKVDDNEDSDDDLDDADDWKAEKSVNRGIMAALEFSQMRGFLEHKKGDKDGKKKKQDTGRAGGREDRGRDRDDRSYGSDPLEIKGYNPTIQLEYRDDSGRLLANQQERFRYISHKFHGKGSGKRKQEKRMNKQLEAEASKKMDSGDTPLGATEIMRKRMESTGQAFVVIQGNQANQKRKRKKKEEK